ncbi:MAG: hypothetical protein AAB373_06005 [Patescibacteria group bacterium]
MGKASEEVGTQDGGYNGVITERDIASAQVVTPEGVISVLGKPRIDDTRDAIMVAESVRSQVFKYGQTLYAPFSSRIR